ncbi:hypothetical protein COV61_01860 [Candidatus Micrarchaeota archaeon CG11_big_fil_rev_8_21_14_0_20_47_5]|nr:MAG: hypothetical protein AUJ17_00625 [Candidatus Micrarchaeota archaeon CG1_02_47_40]PIN83861.1 MAG: hypothetical protein COV61_01860 [Candidatus Micrarchaeota archaeon CG11_big_fil_rev_8_21_14_0_20_47_5]
MGNVVLPPEIASYLRRFSKNKKITACYLFGSYLKTPKKARDVDVCFITEGMKLGEMAKMAAEFDAPYDVSFMERMNDCAAFNVFRDGKPLFINDGNALARKWREVVGKELKYGGMRKRIFEGVKKWMNSKAPQTG